MHACLWQGGQQGSESDEEDVEATRMEQDMDLWQTRRSDAEAAAASGAAVAEGGSAAAAAAVPAGDAEARTHALCCPMAAASQEECIIPQTV